MLLGAVICVLTPLRAQPQLPSSGAHVNWASYGGDPGHQRYSPLGQITSGNFSALEVAWRFKTTNFDPSPEFEFESTPVVIDGVLYTTAGSRRDVVALDAATGELRWMYRVPADRRP